MKITNTSEKKQESKNPHPRLSVVVPSYNHAPFVEQCLKSIFRQTLFPDELLVIDDGSKDNSPEIIEKILKQCPFPSELIVRSNRGLCATLNEAFDKTRGDYFAYLGSDDLWLPGFLDARVKLLQTKLGAVLGYGHAYIIDGKDRIFDCTADWAKEIYIDGDTRPMLYTGYAPVSSSVFYRRWNENSKLEDYELYLQLAQDGEFAFDERILSAWRQHGYNTGEISFFLEEGLKAQRACAPLIGWDEKQLRRIQKELSFRYVEEFVRTNEKSKAWELYFRNLGGAKSLKTFGRATVRLLIPQFIIKARKRLIRNNNLEKYKDVKIL